MELSQLIKRKIKDWEGCRLSAYRCPAGVLTIGYGHTGADVTPGLKITQARADALFEEDIKKFTASVTPLLAGINLNNNQFDAIVSLAYNIGVGGLSRSGVLRRLKTDPNDPLIRLEFEKHVNARVNGVLKQLPGLVRRRVAEANHYFGKL